MDSFLIFLLVVAVLILIGSIAGYVVKKRDDKRFEEMYDYNDFWGDSLTPEIEDVFISFDTPPTPVKKNSKPVKKSKKTTKKVVKKTKKVAKNKAKK
jgi:hypothetical protein